MFMKILLAIVVLVAAVLVFVAVQPNTFRVVRGTQIAAPPATIVTD